MKVFTSAAANADLFLTEGGVVYGNIECGAKYLITREPFGYDFLVVLRGLIFEESLGMFIPIKQVAVTFREMLELTESHEKLGWFCDLEIASHNEWEHYEGRQQLIDALHHTFSAYHIPWLVTQEDVELYNEKEC